MNFASKSFIWAALSFSNLHDNLYFERWQLLKDITCAQVFASFRAVSYEEAPVELFYLFSKSFCTNGSLPISKFDRKFITENLCFRSLLFSTLTEAFFQVKFAFYFNPVSTCSQKTARDNRESSLFTPFYGCGYQYKCRIPFVPGRVHVFQEWWGLYLVSDLYLSFCGLSTRSCNLCSLSISSFTFSQQFFQKNVLPHSSANLSSHFSQKSFPPQSC